MEKEIATLSKAEAATPTPASNTWGQAPQQNNNAYGGQPYGGGGGQQYGGGKGQYGGAPANNDAASGDMQAATVKVWFEDKGFGFVTLGSKDDCYVHRSKLTDGQMLVQGATVMVQPVWDPQ